MKFVIITPVRNEDQYISTTMKSMITQTLLPLEWIIVNDGSTDNTENIINDLMKGKSFIKYIGLKDRGWRKPGKGVIESFYEGFTKIETKNYDILAKFDGDLEFPPYTLEKISTAFSKDPKLGITGGTRYERKRKDQFLHKVLVPKGFVGGPFKFYRRECFEDINGLIRRAGWDGVDIIKANMMGWRTGELESLKIIHLKPTGTAEGEGLMKANEKDGDINYYMGGYVWYFLLRVLGRSLEGRSAKIGYYMIRGYLKSWYINEKRESMEFRRHLKRIQIKNIVFWSRLAIGSIINKKSSGVQT